MQGLGEGYNKILFNLIEPPQPTDLCPRQNGMFRVDSPEACDRFVQCVNGHVIVTHKCPPGLIYDDERAQQATCVWPRDAVRKDCGKPRKGKTIVVS